MRKHLYTIIFSLRLTIAILFVIIFGQYSNGMNASQNPILVLAAEGSYAAYTGEILRTEGFNEFEIYDVDDPAITASRLKDYDIVILTAMKVNDRAVAKLTSYVETGGNLIVFMPGKNLHRLCGIGNDLGESSSRYLAIEKNDSLTTGLNSLPLQLHTPARQYTLKPADRLALLYKDSFTPTSFPAMFRHDFARGHVISFSFNLPQNISYTRQGNPRDAGAEMDSITGIRAMDLFTGGWVDTANNTINQADEQMHLLSRSIEKLSSYKKPLPRFWYFPDTLKCLVTLNNDGEDNKETDFEKQFEDVHAKGAKMTLYVKEVDFISKNWIQKLAGLGFEMSGHPDDIRQATNPDWQTMDSVIKDLNSRLKRQYDIGPMRTVTNHWFVWCGKDKSGQMDFSAQAQIEEQNGILLDCNYAHYDNGSNQGHFLGPLGWRQGNYTGSGLLMRFADTRGDLINVFQHFNNVYDQQYMEHDDKQGFYDCFKGLVDRSLYDNVFSFVSVKAHNAEYFFSEKPLMKMLDYAANKGIPVWTEEKLLDFLLAKDGAQFSDIKWSNNLLSFTIHSTMPHPNHLTYLLPLNFNGKKITQIKCNNELQTFASVTMKGSTYAWLSIKPGSNYQIVVTYD